MTRAFPLGPWPPQGFHGPAERPAARRSEPGAGRRGRPKTMQELLGHSTIITTADIYAHVLTELHTLAADAVAEIVDNANRRRVPHNH